MGGASVCDSEQEFTDCSPSFSKVISQDETIPARDELFDERKWKYWVTCYFQKSRCKNWENKDKSFHTQNVIYHFHMYWLNLPWRGLLLVCGTGLTMASPQYQKKTKKGTRLTMASPQYNSVEPVTRIWLPARKIAFWLDDKPRKEKVAVTSKGWLFYLFRPKSARP